MSLDLERESRSLQGSYDLILQLGQIPSRACSSPCLFFILLPDSPLPSQALPKPPSTMCETFSRVRNSLKAGSPSSLHFCNLPAPSPPPLRAESHRLLGPVGLSWAEPQETRRERPHCSAPKVTMSQAWEGWAESQQGHSGDTHSTWVPADPLWRPLLFCPISLAWGTPCWRLVELPGLSTQSSGPLNFFLF